LELIFTPFLININSYSGPALHSDSEGGSITAPLGRPGKPIVPEGRPKNPKI
jgi:hypothetical protein